uniref:AlNc14C176G8140 protein n=1 Tax=Albugo laibachii Nc14 TaxID=890382 RepID=F0WNY5_9STRA|nr:AlNc14C176G8140 [Albugo laibachii Nc14]|eukprot:CCA23028.1 AlNc14C176G8140 [Albugo laibachii Nc14]
MCCGYCTTYQCTNKKPNVKSPYYRLLIGRRGKTHLRENTKLPWYLIPALYSLLLAYYYAQDSLSNGLDCTKLAFMSGDAKTIGENGKNCGCAGHYEPECSYEVGSFATYVLQDLRILGDRHSFKHTKDAVTGVLKITDTTVLKKSFATQSKMETYLEHFFETSEYRFKFGKDKDWLPKVPKYKFHLALCVLSFCPKNLSFLACNCDK